MTPQGFSFASTFNIVSGFYILFFVISLVLGVYVYVKNQGNSVARVFLLLSIALAILHFGEIFFSWSGFREDAFFFTKIKSIGFVFWWPLMLNLFLLMRDRNVSSKWKILLIVLYLYSAVCVLSFFLGYSHALDYIRTGNIWIDKPYWSPIGIPYLFMMPLCLFLDFWLLFTMHFRAKQESNVLLYQQTKVMIIFGIPFAALGMLMNIVFPMLGVIVPSVGHLFIGLWICVIGYAIVRYRYLVPTLEFASRQIFTIAGEMIVITDLQYRITEYNLAFAHTLGGPVPANTPLQQIVDGLESDFFTESGSSSVANGIGYISLQDRPVVYVNVKKSFLYDKNLRIGVVFVLGDITDLHTLNEGLERKVAERTRDLESAKTEAERRLAITAVYTRRSIVDVIESGGDPRTFAPKNKTVAVLFSDMRDFTGISESLSPIETVQMLNCYFDRMNECILANRGEIDKLIGDCIMAIHTDVESALNAAIDMRQALRSLNDSGLSSSRINNGIGINFGEVVAGNIGSSDKMDYTVIGDIVNSASRIEALTKYYRLPVLVSEDVYHCLAGRYAFRFIDRVLVKGRKTPLALYECFDYETDAIRKLKTDSVDEYAHLYALYEAGDFRKAGAGYADLCKRFGPHTYYDGVSKDPVLDFYLERCRRLEKIRDEGGLVSWNGVFEFKEK